MKKILQIIGSVMALMILLTVASIAQEQETSDGTLAITITTDNAFGFTPAVFGSFPINNKVDFTYYGVFWTNPVYSNDGQDSWTETGIGIGIPTLQGKLYVNPSIGFTHGGLLSGSNPGSFGEGITPSLSMNLNTTKWEGEFYFGYFNAIRDGGNSGDFTLGWLVPGYKFSKHVSAGIHLEQFSLLRNDNGESGIQYRWLGPYVKFTVGGRYSFRFAFGDNIKDSPRYSNSFYKLALFIPVY